MPTKTFRHICFTLNNPPSDNIDFSQSTYVRYAVWQLETASTGTPYHQGYVEFTRPTSMKAMKDIVGKGAHLEKRRGTRDEARAYCKKEDTRTRGPWEFGNWISGSGARTDLSFPATASTPSFQPNPYPNPLELLKEMIDEGLEEDQILKQDFGIRARNYKLIERSRMLKSRKRDFRTSFHVLVGDPDSGKSLTAREACGANFYLKRPGQWWDNYNGSANVLIEEIDLQQMGLVEVLALADSGPHMVPVKGGHVNFASRAVYATSSKDVDEWFPTATPQDRQQLIRRIDSKTTYRWVENGDLNIKTVETTRETYQVIFGRDSPVPPPQIVQVPSVPLLRIDHDLASGP